MIQIFCRTERKSFRLVLPFILLREFYEKRMTYKDIVFLPNIAKERQWDGFFTLECWCFDRGTKIVLREFSDRKDLELEIYLYDIYYFIASLLITLAFHCTLILIQN